MKILVVEDNADLREIIERSLQKERHVVETAADYSTARTKAFLYEYDCILLDIMLPDGDGFNVVFEDFKVKHFPDMRRLEWLNKNAEGK